MWADYITATNGARRPETTLACGAILSRMSNDEPQVEFSTLVEAIVKIVTYALIIIGIFLRPDKFLKKLLPDEITDSLPTE